MNNFKTFLQQTTPFSHAGVKTEAVQILANILLNKGYRKAINQTLVNLCQTMINEHETANLERFCQMRETSAIDGTQLFLDLLLPHIPPDKKVNYRNLRRFFYAFAKAGNYLDTLLDWQKDYEHGIALKPTFSHRLYVTKRLSMNLLYCAACFPVNLEGIKAIAQMTISVFDLPD
ncbi:hypothetical protein [Nodularia sp. LEGE 04288]|uniref:hypothetical protein n=1 Tax=Nodularia sp. LEGE 04288 TaxID=1828639 RepID=UPI001D119FBA|nr:hypothetical protein [Nodularia sp. LEGE 04288]MCC2694868.1 hypothetical protein [Nodularia sp. LEGE 04288]